MTLCSFLVSSKVSQLKPDSICLVENSSDDLLCKYTISNAMALSVKLGIWEAALDKYVDSIEYITEVRRIKPFARPKDSWFYVPGGPKILSQRPSYSKFLP